MTGADRRRMAPRIGGALAVSLAATVLFAGYGCDSGTLDQGDGSGSSSMRMDDWAEEPSLVQSSAEPGVPPSVKLSDWEGFGEYWQVSDDANAPYCETDDDGTVTCYDLADGYVPGAGVRNATVLLGAVRVENGDDGDITVVDCSTGEVSLWYLGNEIRTQLESEEADEKALEDHFIFPRGDGWLAYVNTPVSLDPSTKEDVVTFVERVGVEETAEMWMNKMPEEAKALVLENDPEVRAYLVEHYGEEAVTPYED